MDFDAAATGDLEGTPEDRVFFSVVSATGSRARVVPTPAATGVSLGPDDVQVCFHTNQVQAVDGSTTVISAQPSALAQNPVM
eukprot:9029925-Alexandrium_andersonii.AAC.1